MTVKQLIKQLEKLPQDYHILMENEYISEANVWVVDVEVSYTGQSGYEEEGEVRLIGEE